MAESQSLGASSTPSDFDLAWDCVLNVDNDARQSGFIEGRQKAAERLRQEGHQLGVEKGIETAEEVGFYIGFCKAFLRDKSRITDEKQEKTNRIVHVLNKLEHCCNSVDAQNIGGPEGEKSLENLISARSNFKKACALLNLKVQEPEQARGIAW